jgi:hypothetical protein
MLARDGRASEQAGSDSDHASEHGIEDFLPREPWRPYVRSVVPAESGNVLTERKTGLYVPNVETARLVRDERGWLRLAS